MTTLSTVVQIQCMCNYMYNSLMSYKKCSILSLQLLQFSNFSVPSNMETAIMETLYTYVTHDHRKLTKVRRKCCNLMLTCPIETWVILYNTYTESWFGLQ